MKVAYTGLAKQIQWLCEVKQMRLAFEFNTTQTLKSEWFFKALTSKHAEFTCTLWTLHPYRWQLKTYDEHTEHPGTLLKFVCLLNYLVLARKSSMYVHVTDNKQRH